MAGRSASGGWFSHERRFVEWAEAAGYRFDSCISTDLDDDPSIAGGYDLIIDVGHAEYWSAGKRASIEARVRGGSNLASMSVNTSFWQVRLEASHSSVSTSYCRGKGNDHAGTGRSALAQLAIR